MNEPDKYITYLENLIASTPGHVYWVDRNNVYLGCNDLQASFLGLSSRKEIVGKTTEDILKDHKAAQAIDAINLRIMKTGVAATIEEKANLHDEVIYLSQKVPIRNEFNEVTGMLGVSFDITDRKRIERELKEAKEAAEIANSSKDEFIRNIEHDIRTPISGIIGVSKFLQSLETSTEKKILLADIEEASQELINYFNEVLEFSHLESGGVPVLLKKFNLKELLDKIYNIELPAAKHKKIQLIQIYSESLPLMLIGDKYRIQRILINLTSNAIKFTHTGHVKIKIELFKKLDIRNIILKIIVEDTGNGIPEDKQAILYEKFNRGDASNKNIYKGHGLGLRIVKQFIDELEAEIDVSSKPNQGTNFVCYIPFKLTFQDS